MASRPKNEAVLDRLRRLQESRAERERAQHEPPVPQFTAPPQGAFSRGMPPSRSGSNNSATPRTTTPKAQRATAAPSPSTVDRVAMLRAQRAHHDPHGGGPIMGAVTPMQNRAIPAAQHHTSASPMSIYQQPHVVRGLGEAQKVSNHPAVIPHNHGIHDSVHRHHNGYEPPSRSLGNHNAPKNATQHQPVPSARVAAARPAGASGAAPPAGSVARGAGSVVRGAGPRPSAAPLASRPGWVGSTNSKSKASTPNRAEGGGVRRSGSPRTPMGLNSTHGTLHRGSPSPRVGGPGPIAYNPANHKAYLQRGGSSRAASSRASSAGSARAPSARRTASPGAQMGDRQGRAPVGGVVSRGPATRLVAPAARDQRPKSASRDSYNADAYEYAVGEGGFGDASAPQQRRSSGTGTPLESTRGAGQLVSIAAAAGGVLSSTSSSVTQRQLFGELQQVVVQLSQTAMGDQQRITLLTNRIKEYESLLSEQENMIEELEELNVKLASERNAMRSLGASGTSGPQLVRHNSHGIAPPVDAEADGLDNALALAERGNVSSQRTIIATMIHNIRHEKRQRLEVEEKSSKIIAEQQLAIHRLEQQLRDVARLENHAASSRILVHGRSSESLEELGERGPMPVPQRRLTPMLAQSVGHRELDPPPSETPSQSDVTGSSFASVGHLHPIAPTQPQSVRMQPQDVASLRSDEQRSRSSAANADGSPTLNDVASSPSASDVAAEAKRAFAAALEEAGIPSSASPPVPSRLQKPLSELAQLSSQLYEDQMLQSTNTNPPPLMSVSSQPYIPRLAMPRRAPGNVQSYTLAKSRERAPSTASTDKGSVQESNRTHSVVTMSDVDGGEDNGAMAPTVAACAVGPPKGRSLSQQSLTQEHRVGIGNSHSLLPDARQEGSLGGSVTCVSMSQPQAHGADGVADPSAFDAHPLTTNAYREGFGYYQRRVNASSGSALHDLEASTPASEGRYGGDGGYGRASPEPFEVSAMHTARSMTSQCSTRSAFLRGTSNAGASLAPDSPPRGTIGQAAAMDRILDDIKRRHNL